MLLMFPLSILAQDEEAVAPEVDSEWEYDEEAVAPEVVSEWESEDGVTFYAQEDPEVSHKEPFVLFLLFWLSVFIVIILLLMCIFKDGTNGDNKYGPSPKYIVQSSQDSSNHQEH